MTPARRAAALLLCLLQASEEALQLGFQSALRRVDSSSEENASAAAVLAHMVPYGRPILRLPQKALLDLSTEAGNDLVRELGDDVDDTELELVRLTLALVLELRKPHSPHSEWLEYLRAAPLPPVLGLSARQLAFLAGTTVEVLPAQTARLARFLGGLAADSAALGGAAAPSAEEVEVALGAVLRHVRPSVASGVSPHLGGDYASRLRLVPFPAFSSMRLHPDPQTALPLQESDDVLLSARGDLNEGHEIMTWPGWFSNSEIALRFGFHAHGNPCGVGGKAHLPNSYSDRGNTPSGKELRKFNCSSRRAFQLRITPKGWPVRLFVRCFRVSHFIENNWQTPENLNRIQLLDKWPPPIKYEHVDWLGWTQADKALKEVLLEYCSDMKRQLRESVNASLVDSFRRSDDPIDKLLWRVRGDESTSFKECVALQRSLPS